MDTNRDDLTALLQLWRDLNSRPGDRNISPQTVITATSLAAPEHIAQGRSSRAVTMHFAHPFTA